MSGTRGQRGEPGRDLGGAGAGAEGERGAEVVRGVDVAAHAVGAGQDDLRGAAGAVRRAGAAAERRGERDARTGRVQRRADARRVRDERLRHGRRGVEDAGEFIRPQSGQVC
jgi:hypothetical protein